MMALAQWFPVIAMKKFVRPALRMWGNPGAYQASGTKGILRRRSRKELEREIRLFRVISLDGMIIGCAAIHLFSGEKVAELACLVVHPDYREKTVATFFSVL